MLDTMCPTNSNQICPFLNTVPYINLTVKKMKIETYGKQGYISKIRNFDAIYKHQKFVNGFEIFKPKLNKWKVVIGGTICAASLLTPGIPLELFVIPATFKWVIK